jgi:hypothetical protein
MPMARRATMMDRYTRPRATTANLGTGCHMLWRPNGDDATHGGSASGGNDSKVTSGSGPITAIHPSGQEVSRGFANLICRQPFRRLMLHHRPPQAVRPTKTGGCSINWAFNRAEHVIGHSAA